MSTMRTLRNHIGGEWVESSAGDCLELTNPATAEPLCRVPLSTQRLGGGGVGEFEAVARGGLDPLAADMIAQCPHGAHRDNPLEPSSDACEGLSIGRWCNIK